MKSEDQKSDFLLFMFREWIQDGVLCAGAASSNEAKDITELWFFSKKGTSSTASFRKKYLVGSKTLNGDLFWIGLHLLEKTSGTLSIVNNEITNPSAHSFERTFWLFLTSLKIQWER